MRELPVQPWASAGFRALGYIEFIHLEPPAGLKPEDPVVVQVASVKNLIEGAILSMVQYSIV